MMNSGIYVIRHRESGKSYVGRSTNIRGRWDLHKRHTEQHRDKSPLHRAMRKHGYEAFDWYVLVAAPAKMHITLEEAFIRDMGTMVPAGYNVGGAAGGYPPRELLDAMGEDERAEIVEVMRSASSKMHTTLAERRKDPAYDAQYRAIKSEAAKRRWAARKARIASDPEFAEEADRKWRERAGKAARTIHERRAADPIFDAQMRANQRKAARAASAARSLAATRREGR